MKDKKMANTMLRVRVHVQDDPEFRSLGDGARRFIGWRTDEGDYRLFDVASLQLFDPIKQERFDEMKAQIEEEPIANPQTSINAIEDNRSRYRTCGLWDGGSYAMKIIDKLLGLPVSDDDFNDSGDAIAQEQARKAATTADEEPPKGKGKAKKKEPEPPPAAPAFQRGDRVYRKGDTEQSPGTITEPGIEQSNVKWDVAEYGHGFEANAKLVLIPKEAKVPAAAKKTTAKKTTAKKATKPAAAKKVTKWPEGKLYWLTDENPRRPGTRAHKVVGATMKLGNGKYGLEAAHEKTGYTLADYEHDKKRKHVELRK